MKSSNSLQLSTIKLLALFHLVQQTKKCGEFGDGEVYAIYVLAEHYRQGVGRVLFSRAAQNGVGKGGKSLVVSFIAQNKRAVKFYRSMGGIEVGNGDVEISRAVIPEKIYVFRSLATLTP